MVEVISISGKDVTETLNATQKIIDSYCPRLTGTQQCKDSATEIHSLFSGKCDSVSIEDFDVHPMAFLHFIKFDVVMYIIGSIFLYFNYIYVAGFLFLAAIVVLLSQFIFYLGWFDKFYPKKKGYNVVGTIEPKGEVKQQVILSGHHDSAYVFNFLVKQPKYYGLKIIAGLLPFIINVLGTWIWGIYLLFTGRNPFYASWWPIWCLISIAFVIHLYFFSSNQGTPGAGDNLIATTILIKLAELYGKAKKNNQLPVEHTRLIFVYFDAEVAGLKGAQAYVKRHKSELKAIPSYNLNIDSLYQVKEIQFLTTDINSTLKLNKEMAAELKDITDKLGFPAKLVPMVPIGGGTDAAEFARAGIPSTSLIEMSTEVVRDGLVYHTLEDKVKYIEPAAVEAALKICTKYIQVKDEQMR